MSRLTQRGATGPFDIFKTDTDSSDVTYVGQKFDTSDGREVVLVKSGAVALDQGKLMQAPAIVADYQNLAVAANVTGGSTVFTMTVTLGATGVTANQLQGGYVVINAGAGAGQTLKISSHPAASPSASLTLTLEDPILVTLASVSSKACLLPNPYLGVVVNPTTATNAPVGVTIYPIAIATYGYIQTHGLVSCLNDGGTTVGLGLAPSGSVAGALATVGATTNQVASALQAGVTAEYRTVFLRL